MWGGQVSKHVSGMRAHTSWSTTAGAARGGRVNQELLTWPWDCTLRARVRQPGSGTRRAQGTGGGIGVRFTGRRCASRLHRTAHTSGSNQTIQPAPPRALSVLVAAAAAALLALRAGSTVAAHRFDYACGVHSTSVVCQQPYFAEHRAAGRICHLEAACARWLHRAAALTYRSS